MALRSLLFVPGDSARKIERAFGLAADCLVIDLEDAVAQGAKAVARKQTAAALARPRTCPVAVRVNGQDTGWYRQDLLALVQASPDYVMLPKCSGVADLARLDHELAILEVAAGLSVGLIRILPLITENAESLIEMDYRAAPPRTAALCFAAEDLSSDLGIEARDSLGILAPPLAQARTATVLAARAAGLPAIDTPFPDTRRIDLLMAETRRAVAEGFAGKLCIHPEQVDHVNQAFSPTPERLRWADAVIAAFLDKPSNGVATVDGRMVDKAHLGLAEQIRARVGF